MSRVEAPFANRRDSCAWERSTSLNAARAAYSIAKYASLTVREG